MKKTLGGDRLGSGKKLTVDLHNYNRSTHDLSYIFRSTMSAGTLVPFMCEVALPGDTFDINLDCDIKTHPTIGPLFGSYKVQLDVFEAPIRLYNSYLHNNKLGVGRKMSDIKLPKYALYVPAYVSQNPEIQINNTQVNPSCLLAYLGVRGIGFNGDGIPHTRTFNGVPLLAYWDIYKNYYANKQEEIGAVIHTDLPAVITTVSTIFGFIDINTGIEIAQTPAVDTPVQVAYKIEVSFPNPGAAPIPNQIMFNTAIGKYSFEELCYPIIEIQQGAGVKVLVGVFNRERFGTLAIDDWYYITNKEINTKSPEVTTFPLDNIDKMREEILKTAGNLEFDINNASVPGTGLTPYSYVIGRNADNFVYALSSQEGLGIKTYQSDLFNNWLSTEWIDGVGGITEITAIDTSSGSFSIDTLNLSKKVYDMLNRIAVSGGSYDDWIDAVYQENKYGKCENPVYHGGLIKELVFQEVVSNSASALESGDQPLGQLAGKGILAKKHKGGSVTIKVSEPSYIIGIISLTPRIDYSQGNRWDTGLSTMDDFHKPALDEIGFQELITEQMAWWDTQYSAGAWVQKSAGKQPAWMNYMTNVNRTYGNFAIESNEMFMTLNRRYEGKFDNPPPISLIKDLTTYIDPVKYNQIFAQTSLDAQNFWSQIAVDITARRLMSARIMPNL